MIPQLTIPQSGDPYYNRISTGGYNPCAYGNPQRRVTGLNVLPNCVGYAVGRFNSIGDYGYCKWLAARGDACDFIKIAKAQNLEVTDEPTIGGVMVWSGGKGGYGHVAVVELIQGDTIHTSESEYYGKPFVVYKRSGKDWRDGCYWMGSSYHYLGCIKNPAVEDDMTEKETIKLIEKMFPTLFRRCMEEYEKHLRTKPADSYAEEALEWAKEKGIMVGDKTGNQMPQSPVKREDLVTVLYAQEKVNGE